MDDIPPSEPFKILIIRLSSIGDIVLTTPIIRALKTQVPNAEIHYLVKKQFRTVLENNPYIAKLHFYHSDKSCIEELQNENFNYIADLQKNMRSLRIVMALKCHHGTFRKYNFHKWVNVRLKMNVMPKIHIVDRYFAAVKSLNVTNDNLGLDYFIPKEDEVDTGDFPAVFEDGFVAIALGSNHETKRLPVEKIIEISRILFKPVMLLGGKDVAELGEEIEGYLGERAYNACGKYNLNQSASILKSCSCLLTGDTGLMHIAAALNIPIASVWGNTIPEFGMYPYMPKNREQYRLFEINTLNCRPCSKLGYKKCPRGHFKCMNCIDAQEIAEWINRFE